MKGIKQIGMLLVVVLFSYGTMAVGSTFTKYDISDYKFGEIQINGTTYTADVVLWPNGKIEAGPKDMHGLTVRDFEELFNSEYKSVLIGTGDEGKAGMDFRSKLKKEFKNRGIELKLINTHEAVKIINENQDKQLVAFLHITC